jgi:hypothetical protein
MSPYLDLSLKILAAIGSVATAVGVFLAWHALRINSRALRINSRSFEQAHEWNRRKTAADVNAAFLQPHIQSHWQRIYEPVLVHKAVYDDLSPEVQQSVRELLTFLEHVAIQIRQKVVDTDIVFDLLGGA